MAIRNPLRIGLHVRRAVTQELVEPVFAAALDHMAVRPRASEEEQLAGDAGLVDSDDGLDGGAGVEPFPGAAAPEDEVCSLFVVRRWSNVGAEWHLDDRRARLRIELALLSEGHHQQVAVAKRAADAPLLGLQMDTLPHGRLAPVHLSQLEDDGIKEVVDDALAAAHAAESARRLADEHVGVV